MCFWNQAKIFVNTIAIIMIVSIIILLFVSLFFLTGSASGFLISSNVMKTTLATKGKRTSSVSLAIGKDGGCIRSSESYIFIPEDAVSTLTTFTLETDVDPLLMPPVDIKNEQILSPVLRILPSPVIPKFGKHAHLFFLPVVPLAASNQDVGGLLELKMSQSINERKVWKTVLHLNTKSNQFTTASSVSYDPKTFLEYVSHFRDFAWVRKVIRWLRRALGIIPSSRNISYALFGKEILRFRWEIVAYIIHFPIYDTLVKDLRARSYHELHSPLRDCIGVNGKVRLEISCSVPWKVICGGDAHEISTESIWNAAVDARCFRRFNLEATNNIVDTLDCIVNAIFIPDEKCPATFLPVSMPVSHSLDSALISQPEIAGIANYYFITNIFVICMYTYQLL